MCGPCLYYFYDPNHHQKFGWYQDSTLDVGLFVANFSRLDDVRRVVNLASRAQAEIDYDAMKEENRKKFMEYLSTFES